MALPHANCKNESTCIRLKSVESPGNTQKLTNRISIFKSQGGFKAKYCVIIPVFLTNKF